MVVWPANLDSTKSRKQGRKLAKGAAIQTPRLEEINEAATKLSLEAELVPTKSKPSAWWEKSGYAIFPKKAVKADILRSLASEIRKSRIARAEPEKTRRA
jgi:signal recognition particle subunit SRP19